MVTLTEESLALQVGGWAQGQPPSPGKNLAAKKSQSRNARWINGQRLKRVKRNTNLWINTGTWNIMTMLKSGKMNEIAEQMLSIQIHIIALQEIRWKGHGQIKKNMYSLYYSCSQQRMGQRGTGFMVRKEVEKNIMSFTPINERICILRLKGKFHHITLINVHAPTEEKMEEEKDKLHDDLQKTYKRAPKHDIVMILEDLNVKIGKEKGYQSVTGKNTLHDVSNQNGEMVCNFPIENNLTVMSTQFQHKTIHKGTWISPDLTTVNQIDHTLINKNKKKNSTECTNPKRTQL